MRTLVLIAVVLASTGASGVARAHMENMPETLRMTVHVQRHGATLEVLIRTPLILLTNVGLPLRGDHDVDAVAFYEDDPHVPGDATYAERASQAVLRAIRIDAGSTRLPLEAERVRLAPEDDAAFTTIDGGAEPASSSASAAWTGPPVHHHRGYLDILAHASLPARTGELALTPVVGPALAERLVLEVRERIGASEVRTHVLDDARGTLRLN